MRTPLLASRAKVSFVLAIAALSSLTLHCSSDEGLVGTGGTSTTPTSGSGGITSGGSAGSTTATGGVTSAGTTTGGVATGGSAGTAVTGGGGSAAAGGGTSGAGGSVGGSSGGGGAGGGTGGGATVSFAQVKGVLATGCKGSSCHDAKSMFHVDWVTETDYYKRLTTAIPSDRAHCVGKIPIVPGNLEMSFLYQTLVGEPTCNKQMGGGTEIVKMPKDCGKAPVPPATMMVKCLTADQIKIVGDWIMAGAPM